MYIYTCVSSKAFLKVSKYQKQFFLKIHWPKTNEILDKILSYEAKGYTMRRDLLNLYVLVSISKNLLNFM
jgi:hypothetical protein